MREKRRSYSNNAVKLLTAALHAKCFTITILSKLSRFQRKIGLISSYLIGKSLGAAFLNENSDSLHALTWIKMIYWRAFSDLFVTLSLSVFSDLELSFEFGVNITVYFTIYPLDLF